MYSYGIIFLFLNDFHHEDRIPVYESIAAGTLKSSVFSAQVQMQAAGHIDYNNNDVGEYSFLNQLSGRRKLITGLLAENVKENGLSQANNYNFIIYLPDGRGGMYDAEGYRKELHKDLGVSLREQYYLAVAWPVDWSKARRIFVMGPDGQIRSTNLHEEREAFKKNPTWQHFYKVLPNTLEEIEAAWSLDKWPYYAR